MRARIDKRLYMIVAIIAIALIGVFVAATCCIINMRYAINSQVYSNLADVADQTDYAIEKRVELYYNLMVNLRTELEVMEEDGIDPTEGIVELKSYAEANGLRRVAFCDKDGKAYSSDQTGETKGTDLSYREFYKRGMQGLSTITEMLDDALATGETIKINILTSPWYADDGTIRGVFGITFYSERIGDLLQVDAFDGEGGSFAVNESGEIVIDSSGSDENHTAENFIDVLKDESNNGKNDSITSKTDAESLSKIEEELRSSDSSQGTVYIDGEERLYYQKTLSFDCLDGDVKWNIFTTVSKSYVRSRFFVVNMDFYSLVGIFIVIFLLSMAAVMFLARRYRRTIERVAYIDVVTGGDNYAMYIKRLRRGKVKNGAFVCMDIIGFNSVRIAVGPVAGDNILRSVNDKITQALGEDELIAHVDRDNFALFVDASGREQLENKLQKVSSELLELSRELGIPHLRIRCGAYISANLKGEDIDVCYNRANQANEMARRNGKAYWLYDESDNEQMLYEHKLAGYFHEAIEKEEFEVWYQPKYGVKTGRVVGAEALVRWRRDGKLISPNKFIKLFESNGMISRLDEYMFRQVCRYQKRRQEEGKRIVPVSVNLSRATMYNDAVNIVEKYIGILQEYGVDVKWVQIEITESAVIGKNDLTSLLLKFRNAGEHILLDDFGTGYSSISMLCMKCFDTLKIDKSLVDNIETEEGITLVSSIIHMAHKLDMDVTAEGVEDKSQFEKLRDLDCDAIQGFYFSRPLPVDEYSALVDGEDD